MVVVEKQGQRPFVNFYETSKPTRQIHYNELDRAAPNRWTLQQAISNSRSFIPRKEE
jgi:hypothetical protein